MLASTTDWMISTPRAPALHDLLERSRLYSRGVRASACVLTFQRMHDTNGFGI
jgi:hypothetical protein